MILGRNVSLTEWALFVLAFPLVVAVRLALCALPSRVILRLVRHFESSKTADATDALIPVSTMLWAVEAASRRIPRASCLTQAIAAKLLLQAFGRDARLCLGVARTGEGALRAHAWLERDGRPVLGGAGVQSLVRLPNLSATDVPASFTR